MVPPTSSPRSNWVEKYYTTTLGYIHQSNKTGRISQFLSGRCKESFLPGGSDIWGRTGTKAKRLCFNDERQMTQRTSNGGKIKNCRNFVQYLTMCKVRKKKGLKAGPMANKKLAGQIMDSKYT